ncbi:MAG: response regulator [Flavobacteriales bacterium]|nr:response regulator [Flavobacteriales bacterium]
MSTERIKVLYVDDEAGNLTAFKATYRREWEVHVASSAQEALDILAQHPVHVLVSDQRMPGTTGSELLAQVRERHPRIMRMLLTGYADLEAVVEAVNKGGIYAYATKPWDPNDLRLRVQQAFEVYNLRDERELLLQRYHQVFENSGDPIIIVTDRGVLVEANAAAEKLLGLPPGQAAGTDMRTRIEDPAALLRSLRAKRDGSGFVNVDLTLKSTNDRLIDCLLTANPLGVDGEGRRLYQAIIKDISDRKQEELQLRRLNADLDRRVAVRTRQLLEALEDLGSFSYSVAHDLRSPLKTLAAMSEHLAGAASTATDIQECRDIAQRIHNGSQRMLQLVDDLLRFSQTNAKEVNHVQVDLNTLVNELVVELVPAERRAQVELNIAPGTQVSGDQAMLKVALSNLLSNALKYSRTVERPQIRLAHERSPDGHVIRVTDNGVGFEAERGGHIFGVFKRLHRADQFEGTGVGLAIVHRIVTKHGGSIIAEGAPGRGASFTMTLPDVGQPAQLPMAS